MGRFISDAAKRALDLLCVVLGGPFVLGIAAYTRHRIKKDSPGDAIYSGKRLGKNGVLFPCYKFRSMYTNGDEILEQYYLEHPEKKAEYEKYHKLDDDPRVTPFGSFIRGTSIDELPQMWNVLIGNMSLVGPRPERPQFVEKFKEEIPRYMVKHQVRPGLTGWAQVSGYRGDTSIMKRIEYDLYYIENWTLGFDIKILFLTFFKGFVNKNAY